VDTAWREGTLARICREYFVGLQVNVWRLSAHLLPDSSRASNEAGLIAATYDLHGTLAPVAVP
jgi:hypothetical protein